MRYSIFISYISKLFHLRENNTPDKLERFKGEILNNKKFEYKRWFLEKLEEIETENWKVWIANRIQKSYSPIPANYFHR